MIKHIIVLIITAISILQQSNFAIMNRIIHDETLIAPGVGAEKIILNETVSKLNDTYQGLEYRTAKLKEESDLFRDVLKLNMSIGIKFNEIRYFYSNNAVVFLKNNIVQTVAGLNTDRITVDTVDLMRGTSYFILNYGNASLQILKESGGNAYIYPTKGIAILDDNNDDSIDLYFVFPPVKQ